MTKLAFGTHPFLLGFEQLERLVERTAKSGNLYEGQWLDGKRHGFGIV